MYHQRITEQTIVDIYGFFRPYYIGHIRDTQVMKIGKETNFHLALHRYCMKNKIGFSTIEIIQDLIPLYMFKMTFKHLPSILLSKILFHKPILHIESNAFSKSTKEQYIFFFRYL